VSGSVPEAKASASLGRTNPIRLLGGWEDPGSLAARARARRWDMLLERFPDFETMRVLDLGGILPNWEGAPVRPRAVTILNLEPESRGNEWVRTVTGDACNPPDEVRSQSFDLVYSNSTLEHVGGYHQRRQLAGAALSMAPHHWVQTPYRYFPVEPHWLFPWFQLLPVPARAVLSRNWPLAREYVRSPRWPRSRALDDVLEVELISRSEMAHLFPESEILAERFAGMTKSLIATR
jgi:hypothetical protein